MPWGSGGGTRYQRAECSDADHCQDQATPYRWSIGSTRLADVANVEKMMPRSFITEDGFNITQEARDYFQPLIHGEAYRPTRTDFPVIPS